MTVARGEGGVLQGAMASARTTNLMWRKLGGAALCVLGGIFSEAWIGNATASATAPRPRQQCGCARASTLGLYVGHCASYELIIWLATCADGTRGCVGFERTWAGPAFETKNRNRINQLIMQLI